MKTSKHGRLSLALVAVCALAGCDREPAVSQTSQPKDTSKAMVPPAPGQAAPAVPMMPGMQMPGMAQAAAGTTVAWTAPAGWREDKTPRPMREATFQVGEGDKLAEIVVTRLGGQFGDLTSNINRWRGQVGLDPLADAAGVGARDAKSPAGDMKVYDLEGPAKKMIVGILKQGDANWFFKITGEKGTVTQNAPGFDQFLQSLRIVNETAGDK